MATAEASTLSYECRKHFGNHPSVEAECMLFLVLSIPAEGYDLVRTCLSTVQADLILRTGLLRYHGPSSRETGLFSSYRGQ